VGVTPLKKDVVDAIMSGDPGNVEDLPIYISSWTGEKVEHDVWDFN
jgi:hypothetical protein